LLGLLGAAAAIQAFTPSPPWCAARPEEAPAFLPPVRSGPTIGADIGYKSAHAIGNHPQFEDPVDADPPGLPMMEAGRDVRLERHLTVPR
jgi:hypothetical protein